MRIEDALRVAADADLDLVEVAPDARPPVCKIMDYGKFKYETAQKARESRKNQQGRRCHCDRGKIEGDGHIYRGA